ncbi:hypothetical protein HK102_012167, partial [Quaeritorhiza haematococci]
MTSNTAAINMPRNFELEEDTQKGIHNIKIDVGLGAEDATTTAAVAATPDASGRSKHPMINQAAVLFDQIDFHPYDVAKFYLIHAEEYEQAERFEVAAHVWKEGLRLLEENNPFCVQVFGDALTK